MKLLVTLHLVSLSALCFAVKYDPYRQVDENVTADSFSMEKFQSLYSDWDSVSLSPLIDTFPIDSKDLFEDENDSKDILSRLSGEIIISNATVYGFEDQQWQYWTAPNGTAPCDSCKYKIEGTGTAERYYGGFSARLRAFEAKLNITVDGSDKICDLVGVPLKRNSVAHHSLGNKVRVDDHLDYFRLYFDFAFISSIGLEIKNWSLVDDFPNVNGSRFYLETMKDNETWPSYKTRYHSPLFNLYLAPSCLKLSYSRTRYLNRALSEHLDIHLTELLEETMQSHFVNELGLPYENYILQNDDGLDTTAAVQAGGVSKPKAKAKPKPKPDNAEKPEKSEKPEKATKPKKVEECERVKCSNCSALNKDKKTPLGQKLKKALCQGGKKLVKAIVKEATVICITAACAALFG